MPNELPNNLRLSILGNQEISQKCQIFIELLPSPYSHSRNENAVNTSKNLLKYRNLNPYRSALFHMKTRVGLKCLVNDCSCSHMDMYGSRPVTASSR